MKIKLKIIFLILFTIFIVAFVFLPGYNKLHDLRKQNEDLENKISNLQQKNIELIEQKERLTNDILYIEKIAREKMGLTREGEIIYRIKE